MLRGLEIRSVDYRSSAHSIHSHCLPELPYLCTIWLAIAFAAHGSKRKLSHSVRQKLLRYLMMPHLLNTVNKAYIMSPMTAATGGKDLKLAPASSDTARPARARCRVVAQLLVDSVSHHRSYFELDWYEEGRGEPCLSNRDNRLITKRDL
jgi:hypothetical protein